MNAPDARPDVHMIDVLDCLEAQSGLTRAELCSRRKAEIVVARMLGYWLCGKLTEHSLPTIGRFWGGRDHTTVLYGTRRVEARIASDPAFAGTAEALRRAVETLAAERRPGRRPERAASPVDVARRVLEAAASPLGAMRAATSVPADDILSLCAELVRLDNLRAAALLRPEPATCEPGTCEPGTYEPTPPAAPDDDAIHDFLGAEACYRGAPRDGMRVARADALLALRPFGTPEIAAVVAAYDSMIRAEHTAAERDATARYRDAVRRLASRYPQEETAREEA